VCYQTRDLLTAMTEDAGARPSTLRVDGGMIANNWLLQCLSDLTEIPAERPEIIETTALGAARLAGLQLGIFKNLDEVAASWTLEKRTEPALDDTRRQKMLTGWRDALAKSLSN